MSNETRVRRLPALLLAMALGVLGACGGGGRGGDTGGGNGGPSPVATGPYECYTYSGGELEPRPGLNFQITGAGSYTDVSGASGSYAFDAGSNVVTFSGAALDGQRAQYDGQANPKTITFLDAQGNLGDSCDHQG